MPTVQASDGTELYFQSTGSGLPLIFSTASFSTHRHWAPQEDELGPRLRVVSWDYRGHGVSGAPESIERFTFDRVVEDLARVHETAADAEPGVFGGLSIGGLVSLVYALRRPERVRALILVSTGPGFKNPEAQARWEAQLGKAASRLEERGVAGYLEGPRARAEILGLDPDTPAALNAREGVLRSSAAALARFARGVAAHVPGVIDDLARIEIPTLILVGEHDPYFHRAAEVMVAKLPRARKRLIEGAGHVVNMDRAKEFDRAVLEFLGDEGLI